MKVRKARIFINNKEHVFPNILVSRNGDLFRGTCDEFVRIKQYTSTKYTTCKLDGKLVCVHKIVAGTFLGRPDPGKEVNHKDGNKKNCSADNLEYVTRPENNRHAYRTGLSTPAIQTNRSLTREQVLKARKLKAKGFSYRKLGRIFEIGHSCIRKAVLGIHYSEV